MWTEFNPTDHKVERLKEEFPNMAELNKEQKLQALRRLVDKSRADAAKVAKGKPIPVVLKFGSDLKPLEFIPSGLLELDELCGQYQETGEVVNGLPQFKWTGNGGPMIRGKFAIWWGSNGCGKTTMALNETARAQEQGYVGGYFNSERALDPVWAAKQGVNLDELLVWEGGNLEQNLDSMIHVLEQGLIDFIVVDTIHAFATIADTRSGQKAKTMVDEPRQAALASKLSRFFRVVTSRVAEANCAVLLIGQARDGEYMEQLTGGHALKHYVSLNLHFKRMAKSHALTPTRLTNTGNKNENVPVGFVMKVTIDKTRINHRDQDSVEIPFLWGLGPDNFELNVMAAVKLGIISKASSFYTLKTGAGDIKLQGRDNLLSWMRDQPAYYDWLMRTVTGNYTEPAELAAVAEEEPEEKPKKKKGKRKKS